MTEQLRRLAFDLSSADVAVAREARVEWARRLAPERLVDMWRRGEQNAAAELLREAEAAGSETVHAALGDSFRRLFDAAGGRGLAEEFLRLDTTHIAARFLVGGVSHADICRAASVRPALLGLMVVLPPELAPRVGELLSASLKNERVLRLFDENRPQSAENETVCKFLAEHTDLIPFIALSTVDAFEQDPLLVANYLAVSGIISRYMELPQQLSERIERALTNCDSEFVFCFACHACATTLRFHEHNALKYAASWGVAATRHLAQCGNEAREAIYDVLGAASTTAEGWSTLQPCVSVEEEMVRTLDVPALRAAALDLMGELVRSPHVANSLFSPALLCAAWRLRGDVNDVVRERLWGFVNFGLARENIMLSLAPMCASFLCSSFQESCVNVRELQLQVSARLVEQAGLSQEVVERLTQFRARGLYPSASAAVGTMEGH